MLKFEYTLFEAIQKGWSCQESNPSSEQ